ncbi:hypothetical protein Bca101_019690 [Brassica carinata]
MVSVTLQSTNSSTFPLSLCYYFSHHQGDDILASEVETDIFDITKREICEEIDRDEVKKIKGFTDNRARDWWTYHGCENGRFRMDEFK